MNIAKQVDAKPLGVRLDRWLWAARFYKTRSLAKQAIDGGKIQLDGQRSKPSRMLLIGALLSISRGQEKMQIIVEALSEKRGPAKLAQKLYSETKESLELRQKSAELRKIQHRSEYASAGRPDKRQRRKIHQFKQSQD